MERKPAPPPGLYENVSFADYRAWDAVNVSALKDFERSAFHVGVPLGEIAQSDEDTDDDTGALDLGRAIHVLALEGQDAFVARYTLRPALSANSNAYKDWAAKAKTEGREIISDKELDKVRAMHKSLMSHQKMRGLLTCPGASEVSGVFDDPETGVRCKMRIDRLIPGKLVFDLKSCASATPRKLRSDAFEFGYDMQAVMYLRGVEVLTGKKSAFTFGFVESKPTAGVCGINVVTPDDAMQKSGILRLNAALQLVKHCRETGVWPLWSDEPGATYSTEVRDLPPPSWRQRELVDLFDSREVTL